MKKFFIAVLLLLCIAAGAAYYFYQKVAYQPDWYAEAKTTGQYKLVTDRMDEFERKIITDLKKGKPVEIPANRMVALIANQLEKKTGIEIQKAVKAVKTTISSGSIEMEMIVDLTRAPPFDLPKGVQQTIEKILKAMPENALNELYIKCDLKPQTREGVIDFDPASSLSVGKMNLPLEDLKKKLGQGRQLSLKSFPVSGFELKENAILLKPAEGKAGKRTDKNKKPKALKPQG